MMTIGYVAARAGIPTPKVRYYERRATNGRRITSSLCMRLSTERSRPVSTGRETPVMRSGIGARRRAAEHGSRVRLTR